MKRHITLAAVALSALPSSAFTLNFNDHLGATVPPGLTVEVPGYGDVGFRAGFSSDLKVGSSHNPDNGATAASLQFMKGDSVHITFLGPRPLSVDFDFVGLSSGEAFRVLQTGSGSYFVILQGSGDGAGLTTASFRTHPETRVPEPGTSLLSLLGAVGLAIRRRRDRPS